mgnify:CR=1 FL=1
MSNCPNCGATITSWKCEYCDTVFEKPEKVSVYNARNGKPYTTLENLKHAMTKTELMRQRLELETELLDAKITALKNQSEMKTLYESAIEAMRRYALTFLIVGIPIIIEFINLCSSM